MLSLRAVIGERHVYFTRRRPNGGTMDLLAELIRRTPRFRGKGRILSYWVKTRSGQRTRILPGGLRMSLNMSVPYEAMVWLGWEERDELEMLERLLRPGDTFVDCGANIGLWSLVAAPQVGEDGRVIAFEPNPDSARRLAEHTGQSSRIRVHARALSESPRSLSFEPGEQHNLARVSVHGPMQVRATTLDAAVEPPVHGIKIDVEGHELEVLKGASKTLAARPWVVVEFNTEHTPARKLGEWPVHELLTGLGYQASSPRGDALDAEWAPPFTYANVLYRV
jgi:FkbM family methyltransferase